MDQNIIVNESSQNLRALGREALKGKWGLGIVGTLILFALTIIPAIIFNAIFGNGEATTSSVSTVYSMLISGPMTLGYAMFAISIFRRRETSPAEVFYGFERFAKAFGLYIVMSIFIFLWTLLLIVPGIIAAFRYSMCFYLLADHPEMGIMEALNESKRLMKGNKWKYFCMNISFIGWMILGCFTLGIGYLWLTPYMEVTTIAFYDIANGSLRSVRNAEIPTVSYQENGMNSVDPITVYKEGSETPEAPAALGNIVEPVAPANPEEPVALVNTAETEIQQNTEETAAEPNNENPKNEE